MNSNLLRKFCLSVSIVGIIGTAIYSYVDAQNISEIFHYFAIWSYSPYIALAVFSFRSGSNFKLKAIACLLSVLVSLGLYAHAINHQHPDPQGALLYVFLPLWQWVGIFVGAGIFLLIGLF